MQEETYLANALLRRTSHYPAGISAAGIRYGSILYLAFGEGVGTTRPGRAATIRYPIELEFGANYWRMSRDNEDLIDSDFEDISSVRKRVSNVLVGRKIIGTSMVEDTSLVEFNDGLVLISRISGCPD